MSVTFKCALQTSWKKEHDNLADKSAKQQAQLDTEIKEQLIVELYSK